MFGSDKKRKAKIFNYFAKSEQEKELFFSVELDDNFTEQSASAVSQIKKTKLSFIGLVENTKTSLAPNSIFVIEVLDNSVTVAIIARKGVFLDIKYLKKYSYEALHEVYQSILEKEVEYDRTWYESLENIITIVSYEIVYALPSEVVIVDNRLSDFYRVTVESSKFKDKKTTDNILKKKFQSVSGYNVDDVYMSVAQVTSKEAKEKGDIYAISMVEKEYFDSIESYLNSSGLVLKRFHSMGSSLYASFFLEDRDSKIRIHISNNIAYIMEKNTESGFEYQQFYLDDDDEAMILMAYGIQETI